MCCATANKFAQTVLSKEESEALQVACWTMSIICIMISALADPSFAPDASKVMGQFVSIPVMGSIGFLFALGACLSQLRK